MLMEMYDPETTPGATMFLIVLGVGFATGIVLFRAASIWVESSLDVPYRKARATVLVSLLIAVGIVYLLPIVIGVRALLFLSFPIGVFAQTIMFSRRHSVSFRKAVLVNLTIAAIPIAVVVVTGCVAFVCWKIFSPFWQM